MAAVYIGFAVADGTPRVILAESIVLSAFVGYGSKWDRLFGKSIPFKTHGGDPGDPRESQVTLPGKGACKLVEGSFIARKVTGKYADNSTIWGEIKILIMRVDNGEAFTVEGTFAAQARTWG